MPHNAFEAGLLRYLKPDQLALIQSRRVAIAGAGGLGSNAAMILVRSGFRHFEILDKDTIDASNLNRQQYFMDEIGQAKVDVLRHRLLAINPDLDITAHTATWSPAVRGDYFRDADIFIEAFDNADTKFAFVQACRDTGRPVISGNGMAGVTDKKPMTVRRLGYIYFVGDGTTDAGEGHPPLAPRVTACAARMTEIALDLTLGLDPLYEM